jgi:hypothetical protein
MYRSRVPRRFQDDPPGFDQAFDTILFSEGNGLGSIDDPEGVPPRDAGSLQPCLSTIQVGAVLRLSKRTPGARGRR